VRGGVVGGVAVGDRGDVERFERCEVFADRGGLESLVLHVAHEAADVSGADGGEVHGSQTREDVRLEAALVVGAGAVGEAAAVVAPVRLEPVLCVVAKQEGVLAGGVGVPSRWRVCSASASSSVLKVRLCWRPWWRQMRTCLSPRR